MTARRLRTRALVFAVVAATPALAVSGASDAPGLANPALWPKAASPPAITDAATEARITLLMARMSLEEKVGQTIQADINSITPGDLTRYPLGAILAGGSSAPGGDNRASAAQWLALMRAFQAVAMQRRLGHTPIPLLEGVDAVHGDNKVVGATLFPQNIGLGAARDPELMREIGEATAEEVSVTGVNWTFAPTLAVPRDYRWGRSYEGYAEDPQVVASYAAPMTLGLQGPLLPGRPLRTGHVMGTAKHFLADGGTTGGVDQGDAAISQSDLIRLHAQGYPPAIDAGILSVMVSFSSWQGVKDTANASLISGVLKGRMGFKGFVVGDWNAHGQIPGCSTTDCPAAMNAGLDMYMAPDSWKGLFANTLSEVRSGVIPMARLDDAVRRILRVKFKDGLFGPPSPLAGRFDRLGSADHRALARRAVRESLVLIKNNDGVLPIRASDHVLVAGDGADDIGKQSGGWTLNWQGVGNRNRDFPHGESIWSGIASAVRATGGKASLSVNGEFKERPDVAVVVFGENPYAEFQGDIVSLEFEPGDKHDLELIRRLKARGIPVVAVFLSGRPLWTNPEINASDAFVAAWLPGAEGGGLADVLIGASDGTPRHDFHGRLGYSWPARADRLPGHEGEAGYAPQFPIGYGLSYEHPGVVGHLSEDRGAPPLEANAERFFHDGRAPAPWRFAAAGAVSIRTVDAGAQENGRQLTWTGPGSFRIDGPAVDLSRQATGDMGVVMTYRMLKAPTAPVKLSIDCGKGCVSSVDVTALLRGEESHRWRHWEIKLSCFVGADMKHVVSPFSLSTSGSLALQFNDIRIEPNDGAASCPE